MPPTEEDIAWFRSTFHPIPKPRLPDDCVEYSLYIFPTKSTTEDGLRQRLREVQKAALELQKQYLKGYIWQRQGFSLDLSKEDGTSLLRGRSEYGDSIEDEWVIVWILRELSKRIEDLYVKVQDNDGEFLLIEAAATLPEWLEPDVAENRVWIQNGQLLIIKPERDGMPKSRKGSEKLDLQTASILLTKRDGRIMHSSTVEEEAFYRLRKYPQQIMENIHHTIVTVPRKVAFLLHQKPAYISPTVEAFYLRDPISLKPLQSSSSTDLTFPPSDLVTLGIAIPRVGYAQFKSQDFPPPTSWAKSMPSKTTDSAQVARAETGMKIACGMEMLISDPQQQDKHIVREIKMILDDIKTGDEILPTDEEISSWDQQEDDEKWLDISFEDLEGELAGGRRKGGKASNLGDFGDQSTQENLQRIVAQFEKFLNDDSAGVDGAGLFNESDSEGDMDESLNSDDDLDEDGEDKDVSFSDEKLSKMMREMMGLPSSHGQGFTSHSPNGKAIPPNRIEDLGSEDDEEPAAEDIELLSRQMEAELNESGALNLNPTPRKIKATAASNSKGKTKAGSESEESEEEADLEENEVDINLARNLLESLKSQAGTAGPGGNLMGLMGMMMPRDEGEDSHRTGSRQPAKS